MNVRGFGDMLIVRAYSDSRDLDRYPGMLDDNDVVMTYHRKDIRELVLGRVPPDGDEDGEAPSMAVFLLITDPGDARQTRAEPAYHVADCEIAPLLSWWAKASIPPFDILELDADAYESAAEAYFKRRDELS